MGYLGRPVIPEGHHATNWPKVRVYSWIDDTGAIHLSLDRPPKGQKATQVSVPAPRDPETLLALLGRATGAAKELTELDRMSDAKRELHRLVSQARDEEQAEKAERGHEQWAPERLTPQRPALETGNSIRAFYGGAPGLGKRH